MRTYYIASNRSVGSRKLHYDSDCNALQKIDADSLREAADRHIEQLEVCSICEHGIDHKGGSADIYNTLSDMSVSDFEKQIQEGGV